MQKKLIRLTKSNIKYLIGKLAVIFTETEERTHGMVENDVLDLSDMFLIQSWKGLKKRVDQRIKIMKKEVNKS